MIDDDSAFNHNRMQFNVSFDSTHWDSMQYNKLDVSNKDELFAT